MKASRAIRSAGFWKILALRVLFYLFLSISSQFVLSWLPIPGKTFLSLAIPIFWIWIDDVLMVAMSAQVCTGIRHFGTLFTRALSILEKNLLGTLLIYGIYTLLAEVFAFSVFGLLSGIVLWFCWVFNISLSWFTLPGIVLTALLSAIVLFCSLYTLNRMANRLFGIPVQKSRALFLSLGLAFAGLLFGGASFVVLSISSLFQPLYQLLSSMAAFTFGLIAWILPCLWLFVEQIYTFSLFGVSERTTTQSRDPASTLPKMPKA